MILSAGPETITGVPAGWSLVRQADVVSAAGDPGGPCTVWLYSATHTAPAEVNRLARGRAVIDYVASLTDGQAWVLLDVLTGRSGRTGRLWTDAAVL